MSIRTIVIRTVTEALSDGSEVSDIFITQDGNKTITLHACSVEDAIKLVAILDNALTEHTVDNVAVY